MWKWSPLPVFEAWHLGYFPFISNGNRGSYPILAQLAVQALSPVLANADPVAKVVVEERLATSRPRRTRHLAGDRPVQGGMADKDMDYPTSPPAKRLADNDNTRGPSCKSRSTYRQHELDRAAHGG